MKFTKIYSIIAAAVISAGAWSCSDDVKYDPTPEYQGDEVYFSPEGTEVAIPNGATSVSAKIYRVKADKELTVGLLSTVLNGDGSECTGIFDPTTQVTFAAGETVAEIPVGVTFSAVTPGEDYSITFKIDGENHTPYGLSEQTFIFSYSPYGDYKRIGGTEYGSATLSAFGLTQEAAVYEAHSILDKSMIRYQFGDYGDSELNPDENDWTWYVNGYNAVITVDSLQSAAFLEPMPTGDDNTFGEMLMITDAYTYVSQINPDALPDGATAQDFYRSSRYSAETGEISINMVYYTSGSIRRQTAEYFQLPGYTSYSIDFTYLGNFYYKAEKEEAMQIEAYRSDGLASYVYKLYPGTLTNAEIQAKVAELQNDTNLEPVYDQQTTLEFFLREPADAPYTLVAVGSNEAGKAKAFGYLRFTYTPSVPYRWVSLGYAEYSDGIVAGIYRVTSMTWDVEVEQSLDNPGKIRLVNPYKAGNGWGRADEANDLKGNYYLNLDITDPTLVYIEQSELGIALNSSEGAISAWSEAAQMLEQGRTPAQIRSGRRNGTMNEDQEITFPGSTLYGALANYNDGEWMNTNFNPNVDTSNLTGQRRVKGPFFLGLYDMDLSGNTKVSVRKQAAMTAGYTGRQAATTSLDHTAAPARKVALRK